MHNTIYRSIGLWLLNKYNVLYAVTVSAMKISSTNISITVAHMVRLSVTLITETTTNKSVTWTIDKKLLL